MCADPGRQNTSFELIKAGASKLWLIISLIGLMIVFPAYLATAVLALLFQPVLRQFNSWSITDTQKLHKRLMDIRRILLLLVLLQWLLTLTIGMVSGAGLLGLWSWRSVILPGSPTVLLLLACSALAGVGFCYYSELLLAWRAYPVALCQDCGYVRSHSSANRCPECGSDRPASTPGRVTESWQLWELCAPWGNEFAVHAPVGLLAVAALLVRIFIESGFITAPSAGIGILLVTILVGILSVRACFRAYLILRSMRPPPIAD